MTRRDESTEFWLETLRGNDWSDIEQEARIALENARAELYPNGNSDDERRGNFATLRSGVSYGGGQTKPMNLRNTGKTAEVVDRLNNLKIFRRIAGFGSCELKNPPLDVLI